MRGWRIKVVFLLIVYFLGFATAIYCLAPAPENKSCQLSGRDLMFPVLKSDEFAKSFNTGMHKCIDFSKYTAWRASEFIKNKIEEQRLGREG
jgi:hypothetical protein